MSKRAGAHLAFEGVERILECCKFHEKHVLCNCFYIMGANGDLRDNFAVGGGGGGLTNNLILSCVMPF